MRELLPSMDLSLWPKISVILFLIVFFVIFIGVYRPGAKRRYEEASRLVFDKDDLV